MNKLLTSEYPHQKLLFFVAQDVNETIRKQVKELVSQIAKSRSWVIGQPVFVDDFIEADEESDDLPIVTVGGMLEIYKSINLMKLPRDIDSLHFEEVKAIVDAVKVLSKKEGLTFEFELDGTYVGAIENGVINRSLQVGLLDEWRKTIVSTQ